MQAVDYCLREKRRSEKQPIAISKLFGNNYGTHKTSLMGDLSG